MKMLSLTLSSLAVVAAALYAPDAAADRRIRCESYDGRQVWCAADTQHGVRLRTQFSRAPCYEGDTWGYSRRGIWVSNGCRAEFDVEERKSSSGNAAAAIIGLAIIGAAIAESRDDRHDRRDDRRGGYYGYGPSTIVVCESRDRRQNYCPVNTRRAEVQVQRQLSNASCSYGYSWGYDRRGIWVSNGCRAEFAVYYR